jgi:hypothetical protein
MGKRNREEERDEKLEMDTCKESVIETKGL